jgi:hypothetical protein
MIAVVHLLAGAVIGAYINSPPTIVALAFFSHYLLDLIPHIDPETFAEGHSLSTWTQRLSFVLDITAALVIAWLLLYTHQRWSFVILGSIAGLLPDVAMPLERYGWYKPFRDFHYLCHWNPNRARAWSWYIAGLTAPATIGLASLVIIWQTH